MSGAGRLAAELRTDLRQLEVETAPVVEAVRQLIAMGLDDLQVSCVLSNTAAIFAHRDGLTRQRFLALTAEIWRATEEQVEVLEARRRMVREGRERRASGGEGLQ